jgi:formate dehydrogenase subunit gamma
LATENRVRRFGRTERFVHWWQAAAFTVLLLSGLTLWLPALATAVNRRLLVKDIHYVAAIALVVGLLAAVVLGDRRAIARTAREMDRYDEHDRAFLLHRTVAGGRPRPGRYNGGQKLNAAVVSGSWVLFLVSGIDLYLGQRDHAFRVGGMLFMHEVLTLFMLVVVLGHVWMAALNAATAGALDGMTSGTVTAAYAREHHPRWDPGSEDAAEDRLAASDRRSLDHR